VFLQQRKGASAIALFVLDLLADLADRFSLPGKLRRRDLPARMAGDALVGRAFADTDQGEIPLGMAGLAGEPGDAEAGIAARNFSSRITTSLKSGMLEVVTWKSCVSARAQWMCRSRVRRMGPSTLMPTWATR